MNGIGRLALFGIAITLGSGGSPAEAQETDRFVGNWQGAIQVGATQLRIVFKISEVAGALSGVMVSVDQGGVEIPCESVTVRGEVLEIAIPAVMGAYTGTLSESGDRITGTWSQGGQSVSLDLEAGDVAVQSRPQDPKPPFPYSSEDVTYQNVDADVTLAGTLTVPSGDGPFPAVVLVSGSGPQNRNEELMNHRPFLVLADHLTRRGIAVLRFDDRGVGESTGDFSSATSLDFASDVRAGVRFLKTRREVDVDAIGVVGHSEGGMIAPMVAADSDDVAYIVLLAGPGVSGDSILYLQGALIARAQGASETAIAKNIAMQRRLFGAVRAAPDEDAAKRRATEIIRQTMAEMSPEEREAVGASEEQVDAQVAQLTSPWFRFFLSYDPAPALSRVSVPVLALNGRLDLQVPWEENLGAIRNALEAGGNRAFDIRVFDDLNHLFQTATTGAPAEYAEIDETMAPAMLEAVSDWIIRTTGAPGS